MNAFIISFDAQQTSVEVAHKAITSSPSKGEWWHYLSGTYIITTSLSLSEVSKDIKSRWPGGNFLIMKASKQAGGLLPKEAWDWINSKVGP